MTRARIRIFYPADPVGVVPGGIDTFLRGLIKYAPDDLEFSLVGMTTDTAARPLYQWSRCPTGGREFDFFPVVAVGNAGTRGRVPLSVRFMVGTWRHRAALSRGFDVFDFHRVEPAMLFRPDERPKNAYFHQDPKIVRLDKSDNLWRHLPGLYERIEAYALNGFASLWCVRDSGVLTLRQRYPGLADTTHFIATWVDAEVFRPLDAPHRERLRRAQAEAWRIDPTAAWIVSVGRLDTQKNPMLMLDAFTRLRAQGEHAAWLVIGDGVLRAELERAAQAAGMAGRVHFLGLRSPAEIAEVLAVADLFALSSAYEGMPMALLEALGCGLPAVVTDVGEVRRVMHPGTNGVIARAHEPEAFAAALAEGLRGAPQWRDAALASVAEYHPAKVLAETYSNYRRLALPAMAARAVASRPVGVGAAAVAPARPAHDGAARPRGQVIGVPIDLGDRAAVRSRLLDWAAAGESRTVCFCNVHSAVLARRDRQHAQALAGADQVLPDGAPIAWTLRVQGHAGQPHLNGPGTMWQLCADAQSRGIRVGLYGSTPQTLAALRATLQRAYPRLDVAYQHAPPFRALTVAEDDAVCHDIAQAGVGLLFVGLGCPTQERWLAEHRGRIPAVMLGVGAAFDFHARRISRAPPWMRGAGLEWLHRLASEPRRLWHPDLRSTPIFIALSVREVVRGLVRRFIGTGPLIAIAPHSADRKTRMKTLPEIRAIEDLVARVDAALPPLAGRVVEFVASGAGEGTSTLAAAFAGAHATRLKRRVLLLTANDAATRNDGGPCGVLQALAEGRPLDTLVGAAPCGGLQAPLGALDEGAPAWALVGQADLWRRLREAYDLVVLDMPATSVSGAALRVAPYADGVVVVVEAEATRAPVVGHLVASLRALRVNVLGTVFNKRRFYLPSRLYRWL